MPTIRIDLTHEEYMAIHTQLRGDGFTTPQALVRNLIGEYCLGTKPKAKIADRAETNPVAVVRKSLAANGGKVTAWELTRATQMLTLEERSMAVNTLADEGMISVTRHGAGRPGRPKTVYELASLTA